MKTITRTIDKRRWWGPVEFEVSTERTMARLPDGVQVELWCPLWQEGGRLHEVVASLKKGLPVLVDGEPRVVLRQPERKVWRRRDRKIILEGDPDLVPPGVFLRARWQQGVGLETSTQLGAARDSRMIRPPVDLGIGFPWYPNRVDRSLDPVLIAVWSVAANRLIEAMHIL